MANKEDMKAKGKEEEENEEEQHDDVEVEIEGEEKGEPKKKAEKKEDDGAAKGDKEEKDEEAESEAERAKQEAEIASAKDEEERERIRERRRDEKRRQRERIREREEAKDREIANLKDALENVSRTVGNLTQRSAQTDIQRVEAGIRQAQAEIEEAERIVKQGIAEQKGDAVAAAQRAMLEANNRLMQFAAVRNQMISQVQRQQQEPRVDPLVMRHASEWMAKNKWYDQRGRDPDSRIALAVDEQIVNEGFDPRTPEYWKEFEKRVAKYLPHRAQPADAGGGAEDDEDDASAKRGSPTFGSGRESSSGGKVKYKLSSDRVAALKEAGMWDQFQTDAKFRARMVARYKAADSSKET